MNFRQPFRDLKPAFSPFVIAGPCSAESEIQIMNAAEGVKKAGAHVFRAGIWKPRTRPGSFEGIGAQGLSWLKKVRQRFGIPVMTEVASREHVYCVAKSNIDAVWIGARTTTNPFAVQEIADTLKETGLKIPVFIKNPVNPDIELWIGALERIYNAGINEIGAIHRGFSKYGEKIYRNPPYWAIPIELKRRFPDLLLIHDPSHTGGKKELISELSQQAIDLGMDGLMIECHCSPECALSDADQQIKPNVLEFIINALEFRNQDCPSDLLSELRNEIDVLDKNLIQILADRMSVSAKIGEIKKKNRMHVIQPERYSRLLSGRVDEGVALGLDREFLSSIFAAIHSESVRSQLDIIGDIDESCRNR